MKTSSDESVRARLIQLRGEARERSPNVRTLAKFAANSECKLATLAFAARVDLDTALVNTRFEVPYGQSAFAFRRGNMFEERLRVERHKPLRELLRDAMKLEVDPARIENVRSTKAYNRDQMAAKAAATADLLTAIARNEPRAPQLLDGAVLRRDIAGQPAFFEADAVAVHADGSIRAGEIKSFPTVDGQADPEKVGAAVAQVAIYVLLIQDVIKNAGAKPELVSTKALLITPKNTGLQPTLTEKEIGRQVDRARRILDQAPQAVDLVGELPPTTRGFGNIAKGPSEDARIEAAYELAEKVGTHYGPNCLAACGMSRLCRERAHAAGDPARIGGALVRVLPNVDTIERAGMLARGAKCTQNEAPIAEQLVRVERLRRRFANGSAP